MCHGGAETRMASIAMAFFSRHHHLRRSCSGRCCLGRSCSRCRRLRGVCVAHTHRIAVVTTGTTMDRDMISGTTGLGSTATSVRFVEKAD